MNDVAVELEDKLRKAVTEASIVGRDFKTESKKWADEREVLETEVRELKERLRERSMELGDLKNTLRFHCELNERYVQLARFVLFCGMRVSPEENITDLKPEELLIEFKDFKSSEEFETFLTRIAVVLSLP